MIDVGCLIVIGIVTWCVSTEGLWGAAHTLLCVLLSALLAMNFFEPLAGFLDGMLGSARTYSDIIALVGLFTAFVFATRLASEQLAPTFIQLHPTLDQVGRWGFAALTGYLTMAVLLTALHTAPLPREFMGFKPERANFFGMSPDRQWLGFTQYVTEKSFSWIRFHNAVTKTDIPHAFDGRYEQLGDPSMPYPNTIWPSFPIRYAMRRGQIGNTAPPQPVMVPVNPTPAPSPGGGTPAAPVNPGF